MSECSRVKPMLPGLLNQELSSSDINEVQAHLSRCVQCREHMSGLPSFQNNNLQEVVIASSHSTLNKRFYVVLTAVAMVLCIGGYIALAGHGLVSFIQDPEESDFTKMAAMALLVGMSTLFSVVAYQRYSKRKSDPYQEVER